MVLFVVFVPEPVVLKIGGRGAEVKLRVFGSKGVGGNETFYGTSRLIFFIKK